MANTECSYEGCKNKAAHAATGLCKPHRRLQLGEGLRPLRPRARLQSPTCTGPECTRPSESHDLCKQHGQQLRAGNGLHVIGDRSYTSSRAKERWQSMDPAQREAWIAAMQSGRPRVRTEEHSRNHARSTKESWARKKVEPTLRNCLACGEEFLPSGGRGGRVFYCSVECRRLYARLRHHGITFERYHEMLSAQGGVCAICKGAWKGWGTPNAQPHIDHCHKTGRVRGLLCGDCNTALGRFGDDAALLRRAADYLEG